MLSKLTYIIVIFHLVVFHAWSQNIDDVLRRGDSSSKKKETTLILDTDPNRGITPEEQEKIKQDSIKQANGKWKTILTEKNELAGKILKSIRQVPQGATHNEKLEEYRLQVNSLKRQIETKISNDGRWKNNDELDNLYTSFLDSCDMALLKLDFRKPEEKSGDGNMMNKLIYVGIGLATLMVGIPVFTQIRAGQAMKKIKKLQEYQAKRQAEEEEKQRLLENEDNIIIIKE